MTVKQKHELGEKSRFGIGEWYGKSFAILSPTERKEFARIQDLRKGERPKIQCPFKGPSVSKPECTKEGGVCSLRLYKQNAKTELVLPEGLLVTTCPYRFQEAGTIFSWVGEKLLGHPGPLVVGEVGFLEQDSDASLDGRESEREDVGRIDNVLVHPDRTDLSWCALEIQAVYFSGATMAKEYKAIRESKGPGLPFPTGKRRPDYRSSGPKRLMPQLQIKVPTLRRWGKKMAVVVDRSFFNALGSMDDVKDISNCDIAWFIVRYEESKSGFRLQPDVVRLTTLERAVEGLTGGRPVSLGVFETRICEKLAQ